MAVGDDGRPKEKPLIWIGSCRRDLQAFPEPVKDVMGYALHLAQFGDKHSDAKPLKGRGGGILEIIEDFDGDAYRAVYTVKLEGAVYGLHAFQKKSTKGIATPQKHLNLVESRMKLAIEHHERHFAQEKKR